MKYIAPSILAADFGNLQQAIEMLNQSEADWIHVDVMDGVFVPNISFGMPVIKAIEPHAKKPLDVHLMITDPDRYLEDFQQLGADRLTVHYEACPHLHRTVQHIKELGCKAGVAINPHTSVHLLEDILADVDLVLVMSVNPGFGGQEFIERTYHKVRELKKLIQVTNSSALIEVDGGVSTKNAAQLSEAGVNAFVAGSFVFKSEDPVETIANLKQAVAL
uniref:Ribulose-phosphate 3-epimerase n=1 Tax=Roseihalotalea indica TaxID=2867963 RepID=A0AA49JIH7_9BACT|nr:ribulose-phosphate 3-epimerase [Tunicatimonas sp. TK19036]